MVVEPCLLKEFYASLSRQARIEDWLTWGGSLFPSGGCVNSQPSPFWVRGWAAIPMHFIGRRAGRSPAEGFWTFRAHSLLRPAGG